MLTQLQSAVLLATETAEHHAELPMPALAYPVIIMGVLLLLMFITVSFSNLGNRHEPVEEHVDPHKPFPKETAHRDDEEKSHS